MARSKIRRKDLKVPFPRGIFDRLDRLWLDKAWDKQLQVIAGTIAFQFMNEQEQGKLVQFATRARETEMDWGGILALREFSAGDLLNQKAAKRMIAVLSQRLDEARGPRSPTSSRS